MRIICKYCGAEAVPTEYEYYMCGSIVYGVGYECSSEHCENQSICNMTHESCKDNGFILDEGDG